MNPILNIAIRIIRKIGSILIKNYEYVNIKYSYKNNEIIINDLNKRAEQYIINLIKKYYPQHSYTTKNYCVYNGNVNWIINFENNINIIKKLPYYTISIAIQVNKRTEIAIIYELINNELFTAIRGQGAQLNSKRLRTNNSNKVLNNSIIVTNLITKDINDINKKLSFIKKLIMAKVDLRCYGSTVLDLAYLAAGRIDGIFLYKINNINYYISGILLAIESGNLIFDHNGNNNYESDNLLIGNAKITNLILKIINK
ncbi:MAG: inositol monophosphatase [Candidatus Lightella neohaematopini]|nr:inositol monophosphatase [Candidatus Lightella neohaematopini]MCV2528996.1 inositol monophosphatase [Candidatus Lightella neohaematopini]